jgi:hypothetical protein
LRAQSPEDLETVDAGKIQVEEDEVRRGIGACALECRLAGRKFLHRHVLTEGVLEETADDPPVAAVVLDQEDPSRPLRGACGVRFLSGQDSLSSLQRHSS